MRQIWKLVGIIICGGVVLGGCGVSKGFVREEIAKSKSEVTRSYTETLDKELRRVQDDLRKRIADIEDKYATKTHVESELYSHTQELIKKIDEKIKTVQTLVDKLKEKMETLKVASRDDVKQLSQDLITQANVIWKRLKAEKEGLERAMLELEKLSLPGSKEPVEPLTTEEPEDE